MALKYDKYIIEYDPIRWPMERRPVISRMEESVAKGSFFYLVHWVMPSFAGEMNLGEFKYAGHPPHIHKDAELLFHIGGNPEDPMDLGAELIMYLGPELEEHHITRSSCIWIPPNFIHSPWLPVKVQKPFLFIEVNQGPNHTEKSFRQLLPREARERIDWSRWPDDNYKEPDS